MVGELRDPSMYGMIPRALREVWDIMRSVGRPFKVSVSMVEIYNEKLQDMFVPATGVLTLFSVRRVDVLKQFECVLQRMNH
jgi:Kinesin motor domain